MKPEWGQKRKCLKCDTFFYDMRQAEFTCPKCKEHYTAESYEEAKAKQLAKLARRAAPKIDDEDLNKEALLQMTEDVPLTDEDLGGDNMDLLEDEDGIDSDDTGLGDMIDSYDDDEEKHDK